jgi:hypothetical protein
MVRAARSTQRHARLIELKSKEWMWPRFWGLGVRSVATSTAGNRRLAGTAYGANEASYRSAFRRADGCAGYSERISPMKFGKNIVVACLAINRIFC